MGRQDLQGVIDREILCLRDIRQRLQDLMTEQDLLQDPDLALLQEPSKSQDLPRLPDQLPEPTVEDGAGCGDFLDSQLSRPVSIHQALAAAPGGVKPQVSDSYFGPYVQIRKVDNGTSEGGQVVIEEATDGHCYISGATGARASAFGRPLLEADAKKFGLTGRYAKDAIEGLHDRMISITQKLAGQCGGAEAGPPRMIVEAMVQKAGAYLGSGQYGMVMETYDSPAFKEANQLLTDISVGKYLDDKSGLEKRIAVLQVAYKSCEVVAEVSIEAAGVIGKITGGPVASALLKGGMTALLSVAKGEKTEVVIIQTTSAVVSGVCPSADSRVTDGIVAGVRHFATDLIKKAAKGEGSIEADQLAEAFARGVVAGLASALLGGSSDLKGEFASKYAEWALGKCVDEIVTLLSGES
jgi:hypothetical protein